jgi:hypothetical protein
MVMVGLLTAMLSFGVSYLLTSHRPINLNALYTWEDIILWVWPASIVTMASTTNSAASYFTLCVSVIANGYTYGFLGFIAGCVRQKYLEETNRRPRSPVWNYIRRDVKRALVPGGLLSAVVNVITYIPYTGRGAATVRPSRVVHDTSILWVVFALLIFLPLFLGSGFRDRAASRKSLREGADVDV